MNAREVSEQTLERGLDAAASDRAGWLSVERADGYGWRAAIRVQAAAPDLIPGGVIVLGVEGCDSRRQALEQLQLALELEPRLESWCRWG